MANNINLFVNDELVDMFDFESISLKRIIKDLSEPDKLFTDYSRSFSVPASRRNNKIFKHYYRSEITNGIDARSFQDAELKVNLLSFKTGNVEVRSVEMKDGKPFSYRIVFYGKLTELAKKFGSDELTSLPLNQYNHRTLYSDVKNRLLDSDGSTYGNNLIYPIVSRSDRFIIADLSNHVENQDNIKNIKYIDSTRVGSNYGIEKKDVFPALKVEEIISTIESNYGLTFEGAIKEHSISEMYMALHRPKTTEGSTVQKVVDGFSTQSVNSGITVNSGRYFTLTNYAGFGGFTSTKRIRVTTNGNGSTSWSLKLVSASNGVVATANADNIICNYHSTQVSDTFHIIIEADASDTFDLNVVIDDVDGQQLFAWNISDSMVEEFIVSQNMPEVKITDFLGDIFKRFNIVAEVKGGVINTKFYNYFMYKGNTVDISEYIERDSHTISRPNQYSSINFGFKKTKTQLSDAFENVNNRKYGELKYRLSDNQGNKLIGDEYKVALKSTLIPLENLEASEDGVVYANLGDKDQKEKSTTLYFFYTKTKTDVALAFDNTSSVDSIASYRMPSNIRTSGDEFYNSLAFSEEIDEHAVTASRVGCGAFNIFYSAIAAQMFDETKRLHSYDAKLPITMVNRIGLNDRLVISGRQFLINSMDTNFETMNTRLELTSIEEGNLSSYKLNCNTYANTSTTDEANIVYMDEFGQIEYTSIPASSSLEVCSIGDVFHQEIEGTVTEGESTGGGDDTGGGGGDTGGGGGTGDVTYSAGLAATTSIPNTSITYAPHYNIGSLADGASFSITATVTPNSGYQIDSASPATSYTYAGNINGADANGSVNFTGTSSLIDTSDTTQYTVTMNLSHSTGAAVNIDGVSTLTKSFTGTAGTTFSTSITMFLANGDNKYWTSYPAPSGGVHSVQSNSGYNYTNPLFPSAPNSYHQRVVIPMTITIPNANATDTVTLSGTSAVADSVIWISTNQTVGSGSGYITLSYLSLEENGEQPSVSRTGGWDTLTNHSYSNGSGSIRWNYPSNASETQRCSTITLTPSTSGDPADITICQNGSSPATTGSLTGDFEFSAADSNTSGTMTLAANGIWSLSTDAAGVSMSPSTGAVATSDVITVSWNGAAQSSAYKTITLTNTSGTILDTTSIFFPEYGTSTTYDYFVVQGQTSSNIDKVQFNASYSVGYEVTTSIDAQDYDILSSGTQNTALTETITGLVSTTTTTTTTTTTATPYYSHTLLYSTNTNTACSGNTITVYSSSTIAPMQSSAALYSNTALTNAASIGYYSDGTNKKYWNGSSLGSVTACSGGGGGGE